MSEPRVFRHSKRTRNLYLGFATGYIAMLAVCSSILFIENAEEHGFKREGSEIGLFLFGTSLFGSMLLCGILGFINSLKATIQFEADLLTKSTLLGESSINLREVSEFLWCNRYGGGRMKLSTQTNALKLDLDSFSSRDKLEIIDRIRNTVDNSAQHHWNLLCRREAWPILRNQDPSWPLQEGEIRLTRKRVDWLFAISAVVFVVVAATTWLMTSEAYLLTVPLGLVPMWLLFRFLLPEEGTISPRISKLNPMLSRRERLELKMHLVIFAAAFVAISSVSKLGYGNKMLAVIVAIVVISVYRFGELNDKGKEDREREKEQYALQMWDRHIASAREVGYAQLAGCLN